MTIARDYGIRLNADREVLDKLIHDYPSHSFVIEFDEAKELFGERNVRTPEAFETALEEALVQIMIHHEGQDYIRNPHAKGYIAALNLITKTENHHEPPNSGQNSSSLNNEQNEKPDRADARDEKAAGGESALGEDEKS